MKGALTVVAAIQKRGLVERAATLGGTLKQKLLTLKEKHPLIGDVRGLGLMVGVELVRSDKSPATIATDIILERMKDRGILLGKTGAGRNVITFQPPLIITEDHIDNVCSVLNEELSNPIEI
jgi:4-aminobutyrate aminotransferase-like enzyme